MYNALALLNELEQSDIDWFLNTGVEEQIISGKVLITEGQPSEHVFLVLEGLLSATLSILEGRKIGDIGPGELVGEYSFLSGETPTATVAAAENSLILAIAKDDLDRKLEQDAGFAARLYRGFALLSLKRVKSQQWKLANMFQDKAKQEPAKLDLWDKIDAFANQFKELLQEAERESLKNNDEIPENIAADIRKGFRQFSLMINQTLCEEAHINEHVKTEIGRRLQREFLPYMLLTRIGERIYSKPRGYAGDFLTIEMIYQDAEEGVGRIGPLLDRCFLDEPPAIAVKNRRGLLVEEIRSVMTERQEETAHVTSMASGPAAEIFDVFAMLPSPGQLQATLIDIDLQALAFVSDKADQRKLKRQIKLVNGNLVYLATGRQELKLPPQDLVYSIGLIDYFSDKFVISLLDYVHGLLKPGGKVILGNFHPRNTGKALMDHILEWQLIHRTEEDMDRLYRSSAFGTPCSRIRFEDQGINLFAECIKQ